MNLKSLAFVIKEGFRNLGAKKFLTIASTLTVFSTVFIFLIVFSFLGNVSYVINQIENKVGIQVFFDESLSEDEIKEIAESKFKSGRIKDMKFISSDEAWEKMKETYFDNDDTLVDAFNGENPLRTSASYVIYLYDVNDQIDIVNRISNIEGVRKVNYYQDAISALSDLKNAVLTVAYSLIVILSTIAIILISNTITITAEIRKEENEIKKLIGATNFMVLGPFVLEAIIIAIIGTTLPIAIVYFAYDYAMNILIPADSLIPNAINLLSVNNIILDLALVSYATTILISLIVSYISAKVTIRI